MISIYKYEMDYWKEGSAFRLNSEYEKTKSIENLNEHEVSDLITDFLSTHLKKYYKLEGSIEASIQIERKKEAIKNHMIDFINDFPFVFDFIKKSQNLFYSKSDDSITIYCIFENSSNIIKDSITIQREEIPKLKEEKENLLKESIQVHSNEIPVPSMVNIDMEDDSKPKFQFDGELMVLERAYRKCMCADDFVCEKFLKPYEDYLTSISEKYLYCFDDSMNEYNLTEDVKQGMISFLSEYPFLFRYLMKTQNEISIIPDRDHISHNILYHVDGDQKTITINIYRRDLRI